MTNIVVDVFPPKVGAALSVNPVDRLVRLTDQHLKAGSRFKYVKLGTGDATIVVPADLSEAQFLTDDALCQVWDLDLPTPTPLMVFTLEKGGMRVIGSRESRVITWNGLGGLVLFARAMLLEQWYAPAQTARGSLNASGMWTWVNEPFGAILTRMYEEGRDQPGTPLAGINVTFTRTVDSSGAAWATIEKRFERPWGTNGLELVEVFMRAGVIPLMRGNLTLDTYENYGTDRSGAAFAAGVLRFTPDNIVFELDKSIAARERVSHLFVRGSENKTLVITDAAAPASRYGVYDYPESNDPATLTKVGNEAIAAKRLLTDSARFQIYDGADPLTGRYRLGPPGSGGDGWVGDTCTLDSGDSTAHDYDEHNMPLAAIEWVLLGPSGWGVFVELGTVFLDAQARALNEAVRSITRATTPRPHDHPLYQLRSEKTRHLGYASLDQHGKVPPAESQPTSALTPLAAILAEKSAVNPTFNFSGMPVNIVKVGETYWCLYTRQTGAGSRDIRLASATDRDGPWTDYSGNPILTLGSQAWEQANNNNSACLVEVDGTFYLFYDNNSGTGTAGIGVATSTVVTGPYTKYASNPILSPGGVGTWDARRVNEPSVIYHDGVWVMAYMGESAAGSIGESEKIGIATASSPTGPWTKSAGNPVIGFGASGFDTTGAADPQLFFDNGYWWIWYSGLSGALGAFPWKLGLAYANDLDGPWTRHPNNPIIGLGTAGQFDDETAWRGSIWLEEGLYSGVYAGMPIGTQDFTQAKGGNFRLVVTDAMIEHEGGIDRHPEYVREAEFSAKGSILVGSGVGTLDDLTGGTDGHVMTRDSAQPLGVKWAAPPASDVWSPLTNGDATTPELIFMDGDVIMVKE